MKHDFEYVMLFPEQIKKDPKYQREIDIARIKRITKNWDDDLVNAPKISLRDNGVYYVFNGQHTLAAWKKRYGNKPIQCKVYRGLTEDEEMQLFIKQEGFSKSVGTADKLRAKYNHGDKEVCDMVRCAQIAGCVIDFEKEKSRAKNQINAVVAAFSAYGMVGHDNFINILSILKDAFFGEQIAFCDGMLKGMAYLFKHYPDKITVRNMVNSLQSQPVKYYEQESRKHIGTMPVRYAKAIAAQYNKKRRTENRIEILEIK